jgi:hypothetical protein
MPVDYAAHDLALAKECELELPDGVLVDFQFPPRILSDNRRGNWNEGDVPGSEPVAVYKNSGPREMSLSWVYIVDGLQWTTEKIASEIKRVRGYFANVLEIDDRQRSLVCGFKYCLYGDQTRFSARIKAIDVKHSDTIVIPRIGREVATASINGINTALAFPLRSEVTVELRLWTQGGASSKQNLYNLQEKEGPNWY